MKRNKPIARRFPFEVSRPLHTRDDDDDEGEYSVDVNDHGEDDESVVAGFYTRAEAPTVRRQVVTSSAHIASLADCSVLSPPRAVAAHSSGAAAPRRGGARGSSTLSSSSPAGRTSFYDQVSIMADTTTATLATSAEATTVSRPRSPPAPRVKPSSSSARASRAVSRIESTPLPLPSPPPQCWVGLHHYPHRRGGNTLGGLGNRSPERTTQARSHESSAHDAVAREELDAWEAEKQRLWQRQRAREAAQDAARVVHHVRGLEHLNISSHSPRGMTPPPRSLFARPQSTPSTTRSPSDAHDAVPFVVVHQEGAATHVRPYAHLFQPASAFPAHAAAESKDVGVGADITVPRHSAETQTDHAPANVLASPTPSVSTDVLMSEAIDTQQSMLEYLHAKVRKLEQAQRVLLRAQKHQERARQGEATDGSRSAHSSEPPRHSPAESQVAAAAAASPEVPSTLSSYEELLKAHAQERERLERLLEALVSSRAHAQSPPQVSSTPPEVSPASVQVPAASVQVPAAGAGHAPAAVVEGTALSDLLALYGMLSAASPSRAATDTATDPSLLASLSPTHQLTVAVDAPPRRRNNTRGASSPSSSSSSASLVAKAQPSGHSLARSPPSYATAGTVKDTVLASLVRRYLATAHVTSPSAATGHRPAGHRYEDTSPSAPSSSVSSCFDVSATAAVARATTPRSRHAGISSAPARRSLFARRTPRRTGETPPRASPAQTVALNDEGDTDKPRMPAHRSRAEPPHGAPATTSPPPRQAPEKRSEPLTASSRFRVHPQKPTAQESQAHPHVARRPSSAPHARSAVGTPAGDEDGRDVLASTAGMHTCRDGRVEFARHAASVAAAVASSSRTRPSSVERPDAARNIRSQEASLPSSLSHDLSPLATPKSNHSLRFSALSDGESSVDDDGSRYHHRHSGAVAQGDSAAVAGCAAPSKGGRSPSATDGEVDVDSALVSASVNAAQGLSQAVQAMAAEAESPPAPPARWEVGVGTADTVTGSVAANAAAPPSLMKGRSPAISVLGRSVASGFGSVASGGVAGANGVWPATPRRSQQTQTRYTEAFPPLTAVMFMSSSPPPPVPPPMTSAAATAAGASTSMLSAAATASHTPQRIAVVELHTESQYAPDVVARLRRYCRTLENSRQSLLKDVHETTATSDGGAGSQWAAASALGTSFSSMPAHRGAGRMGSRTRRYFNTPYADPEVAATLHDDDDEEANAAAGPVQSPAASFSLLSGGDGVRQNPALPAALRTKIVLNEDGHGGVTKAVVVVEDGSDRDEGEHAGKEAHTTATHRRAEPIRSRPPPPVPPPHATSGRLARPDVFSAGSSMTSNPAPSTSFRPLAGHVRTPPVRVASTAPRVSLSPSPSDVDGSQRHSAEPSRRTTLRPRESAQPRGEGRATHHRSRTAEDEGRGASTPPKPSSSSSPLPGAAARTWQQQPQGPHASHLHTRSSPSSTPSNSPNRSREEARWLWSARRARLAQGGGQESPEGSARADSVEAAGHRSPPPRAPAPSSVGRASLGSMQVSADTTVLLGTLAEEGSPVTADAQRQAGEASRTASPPRFHPRTTVSTKHTEAARSVPSSPRFRVPSASSSLSSSRAVKPSADAAAPTRPRFAPHVRRPRGGSPPRQPQASPSAATVSGASSTARSPPRGLTSPPRDDDASANRYRRHLGDDHSGLSDVRVSGGDDETGTEFFGDGSGGGHADDDAAFTMADGYNVSMSEYTADELTSVQEVVVKEAIDVSDSASSSSSLAERDGARRKTTPRWTRPPPLDVASVPPTPPPPLHPRTSSQATLPSRAETPRGTTLQSRQHLNEHLVQSNRSSFTTAPTPAGEINSRRVSSLYDETGEAHDDGGRTQNSTAHAGVHGSGGSSSYSSGASHRGAEGRSSSWATYTADPSGLVRSPFLWSSTMPAAEASAAVRNAEEAAGMATATDAQREHVETFAPPPPHEVNTERRSGRLVSPSPDALSDSGEGHDSDRADVADGSHPTSRDSSPRAAMRSANTTAPPRDPSRSPTRCRHGEENEENEDYDIALDVPLRASTPTAFAPSRHETSVVSALSNLSFRSAQSGNSSVESDVSP